jgi:hypothetical protein
MIGGIEMGRIKVMGKGEVERNLMRGKLKEVGRNRERMIKILGNDILY